MARHRIYTPQPLVPGTTVVLESGATRHLTRVLRLKPGAELWLFNGDGHCYRALLAAAEGKLAHAEVADRSPVDPEPPLRIHLGIGISKGERMDFAIQKAVELGVSAITPLITERCMVRLSAERLGKKTAHWLGVLTAACEQSGRNLLPEMEKPRQLASWLAAERECGGILLDPQARDKLPGIEPPAGEIALLVGPEGGISEQERALAQQQGFTPVNLGPRVLRTETAPLAAIAALQVLWGDFR